MTTITRKRGDTYPIVRTVTDERRNPIDITGYSAWLTVDTREAPPDASTNVFEIAGVIADAAAGKLTFTPTDLQADLTPGTYFYDVQVTDASGHKKTYGPYQWVCVQDIGKR